MEASYVHHFSMRLAFVDLTILPGQPMMAHYIWRYFGLLQAWVSDQFVVVGTKCNKLLCVDAATLHMHNIPLPPKPARPRDLPPSGTNCGIHSLAVSPDGSMLAVGGSDPSDCQIYQIQHHFGSQPTFTPSQCLVVCSSVMPTAAVLLHKRSRSNQTLQCACAVPGTPRLAVWDHLAYR